MTKNTCNYLIRYGETSPLKNEALYQTMKQALQHKPWENLFQLGLLGVF